MFRVLAILALVLSSACASIPIAARIAPAAPKPFDPVTMLGLLQLYAEHTEPVPDFNVPGDSHSAVLARLQQIVLKRGIGIVYLQTLPDYYGATDGRVIAIDWTLNINSRLSTLIHEYAHVLGCSVPHEEMNDERGNENEVCAETVSYLVAREIGLDTRRESFNYLLLRVTPEVRHRVYWRDREKMTRIVATIVGELRGESHTP